MLLDAHSLVPGSSEFRRKRSDWSVAECLRRLGHEVFPAEFTTVPALLAVIQKVRPDVIFNLTETAGGDRRKDAHLCALFELVGVPYTGSGPRGLMLGRDKAISKLIAKRAGFEVPRFMVVGPDPVPLPAKLPFPVVVKPRFGDASEGISGAALVTTGRRLTERVEYLLRRGCADIICEEYIAGREILAGVLHERVVNTMEFVFRRDVRGAPRLATESFKYDPEFRKRWGIRAEPPELDKPLLDALSELVRLTSIGLEVRDYSRFDLKMTPDDKWVFLEVNPNPGLSPPGSNWVGIWNAVDYDAMIEGIVVSALARGV